MRDPHELSARHLLTPWILLASLIPACDVIVAPPVEERVPERNEPLPPEDETTEDTGGDGDITISDYPRTPGCNDIPADASSLETPRYTLAEGFEFVALDWTHLLARNGDRWRAFEIGPCSVSEISLPEETQGKELSLQFQSILACSPAGCVALHREEAASSHSACSPPSWAVAQDFGSSDLIGYKNFGGAACWWSESTVQCTDSTPVAPPEDFEVVTVGEGPCVYNFDGRRCHDGFVWGDLEADRALASEEPPEPQCGGVPAFSNGSEEVTEDGVFINIAQDGTCEAQTEPLGAPVALDNYHCGCTGNPILVTATQVFARCLCTLCR